MSDDRSCPTGPQPIPWDGLSESARPAVIRFIRSLAGGFTGKIEVECSEGGVGRYQETRTLTARDLRGDERLDGGDTAA